MAKSLRSQLTAAADLVAILGLKKASVRVDQYDITFQLDALDLAKVSRQLEVPRKKIEVSHHEHNGRKSIHVDFQARGARWCAVIWQEKLAEFYQAMGVDLVKHLTAEPLKLPAVKPPVGKLPGKPAGPRRLELFPAE